jgi:hypothetical protein
VHLTIAELKADRCWVISLRLNLLIAIMADSFEKVKESERVEALRERAQIVVDMELHHPNWHTFHKYMHVVDLVDANKAPTSESSWDGITGRVKHLLRAEMASTKEELDVKLGELGTTMASTKEELDVKLGELEIKLETTMMSLHDETTMKLERIEALLTNT